MLFNWLPPCALDRARKGEQRLLSGRQLASHEDQRPAGMGDFASTQDEIALLSGVQELTGEIDCYAPSLKYGRGDCKEAVVGESHEAAAMDVASGVQVLLLNPKGAANSAIWLSPMPERAAIRFEAIVAPGSPPYEFALRVAS